MSDHKHGEMDTTSQHEMFDKFVKVTTWSIYFIIATLVFIAIVGA